ncbi:MAG: primase-helicase zinc-binding domain-containing protein [Desulfovibrio sp.]
MPNILDLVAEYGGGILLKKIASTRERGDEYAGPCPSCGGQDRFRVWPAQKNGEGTYWCRGCDRSGDAIQFCMDFLGMTYPEAARHVGRPPAISARRMGTPRPPRRAESKDESAATPFVPSNLWTDKATAFARHCHEALLADAGQLEWLAARGIDRQVAVRFGLGANPGENGRDVYRPRASWGLETVLKEDGTPKKLWLPMGLVVPLVRESRVSRLRIRRPEGEPRYYVVPGSGMEQLLIRPGAPVIVVVEAELDAMAVAAAAPDCVGVLALGSSSPRPDAPARASLEKALHILVALDFDKAGASAWDSRLRDKGKADAWCWRRAFPQAERWPTPDGKDPGDAVKAGVNLRAWIEAGLPPVFTLPPVKKTASSPDVSGTPGPSAPGLLLLRGAGDFLGEAVATAKTLALAAFLERHGAAGVTLCGTRFTFPEEFPEALRAEAERLYEAVETEWIETEGWKPEKVRACGAAK